MPQGSFEKIEVQLLLADLAFQRGDLAPGFGQIRSLRRWTARRRQCLGFRNRPPPSPFAQPSLSASAIQTTPAIQNLALHPELPRKCAHILPRVHAFDRLHSDDPAEPSGTAL